MLRHPHLEPMSDFNSRPPRPLPSNRVRRPCVEGVRQVLAKYKRRRPEKEQPSQLSTRKRPYFHVSREHVARECIARRIFSAEVSGIRRTEVGIGLVMWRRHIELAVAPDEISWKEQTTTADGGSGLLLRSRRRRDHQGKKYAQYKLHEGSVVLAERARTATLDLTRRRRSVSYARLKSAPL